MVPSHQGRIRIFQLKLYTNAALYQIVQISSLVVSSFSNKFYDIKLIIKLRVPETLIIL
jgi:hypothetical protein